MNILITRFPYTAQLGGEEYHTLNLFSEIQKKLPSSQINFLGNCPIFLKEFTKKKWTVFPTWGGSPLVTKISLITFTFSLPILLPYLFFKFYYLQKKYNFQVLYCHSLNDKILLTPLAKIFKFKKIVWVEHQQIRNWLLLNPYRFFYQKWSKFVTIIPISHYNQTQLKKLNIAPQNIVDIPHGVYQSKIKNYSIPIQNNSEFKIMAIARLIKEKGLDFLVKAVVCLQKQNFNILLTIVSNGPEKANLQKIIGDNPQIVLAGNFEQEKLLEEILPQQDLLILPSIDHSETFWLVVAESMIRKIPVVITNVCGISYYLKNNVNAIIIPPKDICSLKKNIVKMLTDDVFRLKIANNGYIFALENFNFDKMVEKYIKILKE